MPVKQHNFCAASDSSQRNKYNTKVFFKNMQKIVCEIVFKRKRIFFISAQALIINVYVFFFIPVEVGKYGLKIKNLRG